MRKRRGEIVHSSVWTQANRDKVNEMFTNGSTVVEICCDFHTCTLYVIEIQYKIIFSYE